MTRALTLVAVVLSLLLAAPLHAQQAGGPAQLHLTVVDETGAAIPTATVIVTPASGVPEIATGDKRGLADVAGLPVGPVQVHVEFPGFGPYDGAVTLRAGTNNQKITLKVAAVTDQIVVSSTNSVEDTRGNAMTTTLEESDIAQLPSDPDELQAALEAMTGGQGAIFQVNGFQGGALPPRDEIRQIRFRTNSFAADNHDAGRVYVQIITKPNVKQWSGNASAAYRGDQFNARNAFAETQTPDQFRRFSMGARGPLVKDKTALTMYVDGNRSFEGGTIFAQNPTGGDIRDQVKQPYEQTNVTLGLEHALTANQTLRLEYRHGTNERHNQGVGDFSIMDRAYDTDSTSQRLRAQTQGLIGKTTLNEFRVEVNRNSNSRSSFSDAPAINIIGAYMAGGAGQDSRGTTTTLELADDVDFSMGRNHALRAGFLLNAGRYTNFDRQNANGTFTFATMADYLAGRPIQYTRRVGELNTAFSAWQLGFYIQDDIRVNKSFSYSLGLRQEMQSLIADKFNLMPRVGFTWNPGGSKTAIRGGYGIFHDWYDTSLYDQTLRVNGRDQRDELIYSPCYPNPLSCGSASTVLLGGRVQAGPDLKMPFIQQASIGIEHPVNDMLQMDISYQMLRSRDTMWARNVNAPNAQGIRPEPGVATVTQFESIGRSQSDRLNVGATYRPPQGGMFFRINYTLAGAESTNDGALSLPANSLDPEAEWGPSSQDIRNRFNVIGNVPLPKGVRLFVRSFNQSASPYTITTGRDTNGDGVINDRPADVGRNTDRGSARWDMSMRLSKSLAFGAAPAGRPGGAAGGVRQQRGMGGGGGGRGGNWNNQTGGKYSVEFYVQADNVLNRVNYQGYTGNLLSPWYGLPTSAGPARRIELGMEFRF